MRPVYAPENIRVEPRLQLVERPIVARADLPARCDGDVVVGERGEDDLFGLHEHEAFADFDGQLLAPVLPLGYEADNFLQLPGN
jgi:hypothetical protein